jgi:hypothetical protein
MVPNPRSAGDHGKQASKTMKKGKKIGRMKMSR